MPSNEKARSLTYLNCIFDDSSQAYCVSTHCFSSNPGTELLWRLSLLGALPFSKINHRTAKTKNSPWPLLITSLHQTLDFSQSLAIVLRDSG